MHPNRSPFDTRSATACLTRAVGRALGLPRSKWKPISDAIRPQVAHIAETSRATLARTAVSRRKVRREVRAALAEIL